MRDWSPELVAQAAGVQLVAAPRDPDPAGPSGPGARDRSTRAPSQPGDLFVGLAGSNVDGGRFAAQALDAGAWGVLVTPDHAHHDRFTKAGVILETDDPLAGLQALARSWRRALGAQVIAITGSTGKTSTKDILAAMLAPHVRVVASAENLNTEIGLPLSILAAPAGTEVLVLEMAMRGSGQIAELAAIAEPDVGVIVNVGPVHLELLGSLEAIAAAKAELLADLRAGATGDPAGRRAAARGAPARRPAHRDVRPRRRRRRAGRRARAAVQLAAHALQRAGGARRGARRRGARRAGGWRCSSARCAGSASSCPARCSSSTTATTPTRCRCAPLSTISPSPRPEGAWPCSGTCSSWGPARARFHAEIGDLRAASAGSTC